MNLISLSFLIFCLITIFIYFLIPKKLQWIVLLISSTIFLFYNNFTVNTLIQAGIVLLTSYFFGILLDKYKNTKKSKIFLIIGISYYSLIMISYLVDIYRNASQAEKNIFKLALFWSYFPILTSGPFIRFKDMKYSLYAKHKFNYDNMCRGLVRILLGIFKLLVISERLGSYVNTVYSNVTTFNGFFIIIAMFFFTLQLYTNFSGSIDIIMGISEILGIELPENFSLPFFSKTITEFWRKWHITLGAWLKDYIFYPLLKSNMMQNLNKICKEKFGKKKGKKIPLYLSMFIMWLIIGIWHGGEYKYILASGIFQFIFILAEDLLEPISTKINNKLGINTKTFSYKLYQVIRTFTLFSFSMIFFRANSISHALSIIKNMFIWNPWIILDNSSLYTAGVDFLDFRVLIISLIVLFIVEFLSRNGDLRDKLFSQNIIFRWGVLFILIFAIIIFGCYGPSYNKTDFIYRQF